MPRTSFTQKLHDLRLAAEREIEFCRRVFDVRFEDAGVTVEIGSYSIDVSAARSGLVYTRSVPLYEPSWRDDLELVIFSALKIAKPSSLPR